jgi:hypothetical protein
MTFLYSEWSILNLYILIYRPWLKEVKKQYFPTLRIILKLIKAMYFSRSSLFEAPSFGI